MCRGLSVSLTNSTIFRLLDREEKLSTPVTLEVEQRVLPIVVGEGFAEANTSESSEKESIKIENLPTEKERLDMVERRLPLFASASEERYKSLFLSLRDESRPSPQYITLMILSTLLATIGIFLDSASVVIGAMVLAPLMAPMVSFSMGVLRKDFGLFYRSIQTILIGIALALGASALFTSMIPFENWTHELSGRLQPSLLDLSVAVISGVAAAFAKADTKIAPSLAGVAISVALVPPLSVVGIGLGWMDWHIISNAMLLFLTNLVGIVMAASLTFLVLGYSTGVKGKKSFWALGLSLVLIAVPLYFSFVKIAQHADAQRTLSEHSYTIHGKELTLNNIELTDDEHAMRIRCDVCSASGLNDEDMKALKLRLSTLLGTSVTLEATVIRVY